MNEIQKILAIKDKLLEVCKNDVLQRINTIQKTLQSIESARNNESKSSAGDKFETGRAMMQIEEDKNKRQLQEALIAKNQLSQIKFNQKVQYVGLGSLVFTENATFFIAIGQGKKIIDEKIYYCISPDAPIGKILLNQKEGAELDFNGKSFKILTIV